jgi:hypothetical protein
LLLQEASPGGKSPVSSVAVGGERAVCSPSSARRVHWRFGNK